MSGPILKQYPLKGTSNQTLKKWLQQSPSETQQEATKFGKMFQDAAVPKAKLQGAAIQYGLPMEQKFKVPPSRSSAGDSHRCSVDSLTSHVMASVVTFETFGSL